MITKKEYCIESLIISKGTLVEVKEEVNSWKVNKDNFEYFYQKVKNEELIFYVTSHYKYIRIDNKYLESYEKLGLKALKIEDTGFRLKKGKTNSIFIFSGQLIASSVDL